MISFYAMLFVTSGSCLLQIARKKARYIEHQVCFDGRIVLEMKYLMDFVICVIIVSLIVSLIISLHIEFSILVLADSRGLHGPRFLGPVTPRPGPPGPFSKTISLARPVTLSARLCPYGPGDGCPSDFWPTALLWCLCLLHLCIFVCLSVCLSCCPSVRLSVRDRWIMAKRCEIVLWLLWNANGNFTPEVQNPQWPLTFVEVAHIISMVAPRPRVPIDKYVQHCPTNKSALWPLILIDP